MKLSKNFFTNKATITLAYDLLWKVITKITPEWIISGVINEVEVYTQEDEASHSYLWKKTSRNNVMFKDAWHIYVYFTYGMHYCMNIVTEKDWYGSAILIRSIIPYIWEKLMIKNRKFEGKNLKNLTNWPAKVCQAFWITKINNWINLLDKNSIIFLEDIWYKTPNINTWKRIWISKGLDKDWRFWF